MCLYQHACKNTGVGCPAVLQGIFPTQGLNAGLPHFWWILYHLSHQGSPRILEWVANLFPRGSSWPRNWTRVSCIAVNSLPAELPGKPTCTEYCIFKNTVCVCVYVCAALCNFLPYVYLWNHHHIQYVKLFHNYKGTPWRYPLIFLPNLVKLLATTLFAMSITLLFWECY